MTKFYYTKVAGKIDGLLNKIREVGEPTKVDIAWLKQIGYKSSNDRTLISVLEQINFVNDSKSPTKMWRAYRGRNRENILAKAIVEGYGELYSFYPNAHERTESELRDFFSTHSYDLRCPGSICDGKYIQDIMFAC